MAKRTSGRLFSPSSTDCGAAARSRCPPALAVVTPRTSCYISAMRYVVLVGLIIGALLGYYLLWAHLSDQVAAEATRWIEAQRAQGRQVSYGRMRQWGFPYRLSLTLENASWHDPQSAAGWRIEADEINAHLQLWKFDHVIFDLNGQQRLGWKDGAAGRQAVLAAERFRASVVLDGAGAWLRIAADLNRPVLSGALQDWSAEKLLLHARRAGNVPPSADLAVQAEKLILPASADGPLGREIAALKLVGSARGTPVGKTPEELLGTWRDSGGIVEFETIALQWGALKINGDGTLTLDKQYRPLGAMAGQIRGAGAGIDALVAAGKMKADEAAAAKAALGMIALRDDKGEQYLPLPLTAQEGRLFLGPVALFALPSILPAK